MQQIALSWSRRTKVWLVAALDANLALLATWLAYTLRLEESHLPSGWDWLVYAIAPLLMLVTFIRFGLYRAIFRHTGLHALLMTARAVAVYGLMFFALLLWFQWPGVPRSVGVLQPLVFLLFVLASRAAAHAWLADASVLPAGTPARLLIYGAGAAGAQTAAAMANSRQFSLLGFLDDDGSKVGRSINGVEVFSTQQVSALVERLAVTDILLALPSASRERRNRIISGLRALPLHVRTLPGLADLASGRVTVQDFHELELEDLLGREPVRPQVELLTRRLRNLTVLVTGAGGSIGSELCRQIVREQPLRLLLLDHHEFGLYRIHHELLGMCQAGGLSVELVPLLGSVVNRRRLDWICATYRPATVYHAAAYKHVPMVECNPAEGVLNNVLGTLHMAQAAHDHQVSSFVLVSTDKAVRPTNVMGASKRMAELVLQALANQAAAGTTCFCMVRFGNVLGSSGSVVPLFRRQLAQGGPLTVTHPQVTRYFMTIPEAAQLVLQAAAMSSGGEVFVLDMGQPVKIIDLARRMITLSGRQVRDAQHPQGDIEISITGLRPGEKLYEELLIGDNPTRTPHPRIMKAHEHFLPWAELEEQLQRLQQAANAQDLIAIKAVLRDCVQGYTGTSVPISVDATPPEMLHNLG